MDPLVPPFRFPELAAVAARLGTAPADFEVEELPAYEPSGEGPHLYVRIRKTSLTTPDAIRLLAREAGVAEADVGSAGMKDKHAVTTQWLSFPEACRPPSEWQLPSGVELLASSRHGNKLRTGHLIGNRFALRLVGADAADPARAEAFVAAVRERGLPNWYGEQRFGRGGQNLTRGLAFLRNGGQARGKNARFDRKLLPSAVQAECFNRYLMARLALGESLAIEGETLRLGGTGRYFTVTDAAAETERVAARDVLLTGPLPGRRVRRSPSRAGELEAVVEAELELGETERATLDRLADGSRRDLLLFVEQLEVSTEEDGALRLRFTLPAGAYATGILRELCRVEQVRGPVPAPGAAAPTHSATDPSIEPTTDPTAENGGSSEDEDGE